MMSFYLIQSVRVYQTWQSFCSSNQNQATLQSYSCRNNLYQGQMKIKCRYRIEMKIKKLKMYLTRMFDKTLNQWFADVAAKSIRFLQEDFDNLWDISTKLMKKSIAISICPFPNSLFSSVLQDGKNYFKDHFNLIYTALGNFIVLFSTGAGGVALFLKKKQEI